MFFLISTNILVTCGLWLAFPVDNFVTQQVDSDFLWLKGWRWEGEIRLILKK